MHFYDRLRAVTVPERELGAAQASCELDTSTTNFTEMSDRCGNKPLLWKIFRHVPHGFFSWVRNARFLPILLAVPSFHHLDNHRLPHHRISTRMIRPATRSIRASCSSMRQTALSRSYASASATASSSSAPTESTSLPSAAPPGTVLKGVSIFKDKADPIALQDHEYPPWLFKLLDDPSIAASSSLASIEMAGMSKGEARAAQKRQSKILRAAQLAKEKAEAKAAERAAKAGTVEAAIDATAEQEAALTPEERKANLLSKAAQEEQARRRTLRRANKDAIKARNFVSAS